MRYYAEVGSTNDVALAAGREGAEAGLVVVADAQTAGRGRLQRSWQSPPGTCLLVSLLFRPGSFDAREPHGLAQDRGFAVWASRTTMVCGLGLREAVLEISGVPAELKWPNDLIVGPDEGSGTWRKLAGMLSEVGLADDGTPAFLVVGMGTNVNVPAAALPGLDARATSVLALTGSPTDRAALLDRLLADVERRYEALLTGEDPLPAWRDALAWMGQPVEVRGPRETVNGVAVGVDDEGALLVTMPSGERRRFTVGDVSLRLRT